MSPDGSGLFTSGPASARRAATSSMLGWCCRAVPRLRWRTARSTNSAPACSFTFHPDLRVTIVGWWGMRRTSRCIFSGLTATQTNNLQVLIVTLLERICECLEIGFLNHPLVILAEKFLQPVGVHNVLARHVRDGVRRNRRDIPVPQELQNATHGPLSRNSQQFCVRQFDALREG